MEKVMEFSNEELREIAECPMDYHDTTRNLAKALLAGRAEREKNPGVWDGAPEWADRVRLEWNASGGRFATIFQMYTYTRTLPKTKAREIAEKWAGVPGSTPTRPYLADIIEAAILEALGGEK